jgi:cell division protein FtsI (penicillin-binding protein 3)
MNEGRFKRRVYVIGVLLTATALFFVVHITRLHFSDRVTVPPPEKPDVRRGVIRDRNGYILALSVLSRSCYANPQQIEDPEDAANRLAPVLMMEEDVLLDRLSRDKKFVWIKRKLDEAAVKAVTSLEIPGIHFRDEYRRVYPYGRLAANILGFTGIDNHGLEGLEYRYDVILMGEFKRSGRDTAVIYGLDITLTIDRFVQHYCEGALEEAVTKHEARQGAVVVMEIETGRVLALARHPGFDPNFYYRFSPFERRNFSIIDAFEPGSTMKIFSVASLLENRPLLAGEKYTCEGKIEIGGETINCTAVHGELDLEGIIRHSCNVGIIKAVRGLEKKELYRTLKKFNFGERVSDDLPGEAEGILRPVRDWSGLSKYSLAIGHEMSVNSLQMASAFSAIASGGIYRYPALVHSMYRYDGSLHRGFYARTRGRVIEKKIADRLMELMKRVVDPGGTGDLAASRYYNVAGKTGTSRKFSLREGGYSQRVLSSFVGLVPWEKPTICVYVVIDEPVGGRSGGTVAAPVFSKIADRVLPYLGIKHRGLKGRLPEKTGKRNPSLDGTLPSFTGMELYRALDLVAPLQQRMPFRLKVRGSGRVIAQDPKPGSRLENLKVLTLVCEEPKNERN